MIKYVPPYGSGCSSFAFMENHGGLDLSMAYGGKERSPKSSETKVEVPEVAHQRNRDFLSEANLFGLNMPGVPNF